MLVRPMPRVLQKLKATFVIYDYMLEKRMNGF